MMSGWHNRLKNADFSSQLVPHVQKFPCNAYCTSQEKKKVQSQEAVKQENTFGSRPGTSSRRLSNRSLNGSLMNSPSFHRSNSASQHTSIIKEEKKAQVHKIKTYFRPGLFSQLRDETASVSSTFSPWILTFELYFPTMINYYTEKFLICFPLLPVTK